jgi:hypothetical protein
VAYGLPYYIFCHLVFAMEECFQGLVKIVDSIYLECARGRMIRESLAASFEFALAAAQYFDNGVMTSVVKGELLATR